MCCKIKEIVSSIYPLSLKYEKGKKKIEERCKLVNNLRRLSHDHNLQNALFLIFSVIHSFEHSHLPFYNYFVFSSKVFFDVERR